PRERATSATRGRKSRPLGRVSATSRRSISRKGSGSRQSICSVAVQERRGRIPVLRVIARLNVGGPPLPLPYLPPGLTERGYDTTRVAGTVGGGEESMAYVVEGAGARVVTLPGLSREIAPLHDAVAIVRLARLIRRVRPTILHTHTAKAGAVGRVAA